MEAGQLTMGNREQWRSVLLLLFFFFPVDLLSFPTHQLGDSLRRSWVGKDRRGVLCRVVVALSSGGTEYLHGTHPKNTFEIGGGVNHLALAFALCHGWWRRWRVVPFLRGGHAPLQRLHIHGEDEKRRGK